ncbi:hypothetical protein KQX54_014595 [Cotesia glomerata]|uniref:Transposase n=1 Tax=Cotesia glomerata TaxID=32391 RepID=A0AAV7ILX2_COTGL|nr:hypothetical protein KQX54_014595 [Cotesia glomerata]
MEVWKSQSHEFAANERTLVAGGLAQRPPTREYHTIEDRIRVQSRKLSLTQAKQVEVLNIRKRSYYRGA